MANWSDLCYDVIEHLTNFLALSDLHRFSAVCRTWRLVANRKRRSPAKEIPWLVLGEDDATQKRKFFNLSENRHYYMDVPKLQGQYVCGSSYGWLFTIDIELNFHMLNPFTGKFYELPPLPRCLCPAPPQHEAVSKAILDSDPNQSLDFMVLVLYGCNRTRLALWSLSFLYWRQIYTTPVDRCPITFDDITFSEGSFYAITFPLNILYTVDIGANPKISLVNHLYTCSRFCRCSKYLVDFMGELLIVERWKGDMEERSSMRITIRFHVYRVNSDARRLSKCKHIDDFALFIGNNSAVVIDPSLFPGCRKNAIYFTDTNLLYNHGWEDLGIYDIVSDTLMRYYPQDIYHPVIAPPTWLTPNPW